MTMLKPPSPVSIVVAGEALIDMVMQPDGNFLPCPGGAPFNLSRALARQRVGVSYLNPFSQDRFGRNMQHMLLHEGVHLAPLTRAQEPTSLAVIHLNVDGHPEYAFYRQGVADRTISSRMLIEASARLEDVRIVCAGCLALAPEDASIYLPWLAHQRNLDCLIVIDINMRPTAFADMPAYRSNVSAAAKLAHILKASDEDLDHLGTPGDTPEQQALQLLSESGAQALLLTLGSQGAQLIFNPQLDQARVSGRELQRIEVVDTIGAGDSFLAGFLACWLDLAHEKDILVNQLARQLTFEDKSQLLRHALATASLNVMRSGCNPPTRSEVVERIRQSPALIH